MLAAAASISLMILLDMPLPGRRWAFLATFPDFVSRRWLIGLPISQARFRLFQLYCQPLLSLPRQFPSAASAFSP